MYNYINGKLVEKSPAYCVIEAQGVGYLLFISLNTYTRLGDDESCKLFSHLILRDDARMLYGFYDEEERRLFRLLISVSGVGAGTAMLLLSSLEPGELTQVIISGKVDILKSIKGIGAKTAQRIIVDLKDKLDQGEISLEKIMSSHNTKQEEALSGLVVLGFNKKAAEKAIARILSGLSEQENIDETISVEQLIKETLKIL
jgi:Holliday junction DNA helicase RuvA